MISERQRLDGYIQNYFEHGGAVRESDDMPPSRPRRGRRWERAPSGLTTRTDQKAKPLLGKLTALIAEGLTDGEIRGRLGMSQRMYRAVVDAYGLRPVMTSASQFARIVELLEEGFSHGKSIYEVCEAEGIKPKKAYKAYKRYAENNPYARLLVPGHAHYFKTRDENVLLMLDLFVELTGLSHAHASRSLKVGPERYEELRSLFAAKRKQLAMLKTQNED
jgi:hypothetical protein